MTQINSSTEQVYKGAEHIASDAQLLAYGTADQASSVENLSDTIDEMSKMLKYNAVIAKDANNRCFKYDKRNKFKQ